MSVTHVSALTCGKKGATTRRVKSVTYHMSAEECLTPYLLHIKVGFVLEIRSFQGPRIGQKDHILDG